MLYTFIYILLSGSEPVSVDVITEEPNLTQMECQARYFEVIETIRESGDSLHLPACKPQGENNE